MPTYICDSDLGPTKGEHMYAWQSSEEAKIANNDPISKTSINIVKFGSCSLTEWNGLS